MKEEYKNINAEKHNLQASAFIIKFFIDIVQRYG